MPGSLLPRDGYARLREIIPERHLSRMRTSDEISEYLSAGVSRRSVLRGLGLAGLAAAAGPTLWARPGRAAAMPRGVHLAYGNDARTSMSVSWITDDPVEKPFLSLGPSGGDSFPALSTQYRTPIDGERIAVSHHVTVDGLRPGTTYRYFVGHAGAQSPEMELTTAPGVIVPFTFTSFGDHGSPPNSTVVASATWGTPHSATAVQAIERIGAAFHVHNGDLAYSCDGPQVAWDYWLDEITPRASKMPWMPTLGNHEMEFSYGDRGYNPYRSRFRLPQNGVDWSEERTSTFYAFQHSNVLVVALDGNEAASERGYAANRGYLKGKQDAWLEATLAAGRASATVDWIVVTFHNCMYCTDVVHASDGGCRARWQPLFDRYAVDVVLNGHNHCYERTYPIRGSEHRPLGPGEHVDPQTMGVTYVCAGGGGQSLRTASTWPRGEVSNDDDDRDDEDASWRATRVEGYTVAAFDVDPGTKGGKTTMTLRTLEFGSAAMAEVDRVVLERPAKAIAAPVPGGAVPPPPPPPPVVRGTKQLADTGLGRSGLITGAAAIAAAAALGRLTAAGEHEPSA